MPSRRLAPRVDFGRGPDHAFVAPMAARRRHAGSSPPRHAGAPAGSLLALLAIAFLFAASAHAAPKKKHAAYLTPESGGIDFKIQGEYVGLVGGKHTIAVQVVALGDGKFEGVVYGGGLPGAGWDEVTRFHFRGELDGNTARCVGVHGERLKFENENFRAIVDGDVCHGEARTFLNVVQDPSFELRKVTRVSPTLGARPPDGAIVLFDGTNVNEWVDGRLADGNLLDVGTDSKRRFRSHSFHLEFRTPFMPTARGMARGNSGVYVKREWEIQVLDSFGWNSENQKYERLSIFGRCGGIHEMVKPRLNMCFPPLSWQTYDVDFVAAKFDADGKKITPATMTVRHNGVVIHDRYVLPPRGPGDKRPSREQEAGALYLQDHGNPVRFRSIWVVER